MNTPNSAHYSIKSALIKVLATLFTINENTIFFIVLDPKKNLIHGYIVSHCQYLISILLYLFRKRYEAIQHILLIISGHKRTVLTYRRLQYMVMISFQYTFFFFIVNVKNSSHNICLIFSEGFHREPSHCPCVSLLRPILKTFYICWGASFLVEEISQTPVLMLLH